MIGEESLCFKQFFDFWDGFKILLTIRGQWTHMPKSRQSSFITPFAAFPFRTHFTAFRHRKGKENS
jgi:hypothetical protein